MHGAKPYVVSIFIPSHPPATDVFATNSPRDSGKYTRRRSGSRYAGGRDTRRLYIALYFNAINTRLAIINDDQNGKHSRHPSFYPEIF